MTTDTQHRIHRLVDTQQTIQRGRDNSLKHSVVR